MTAKTMGIILILGLFACSQGDSEKPVYSNFLQKITLKCGKPFTLLKTKEEGFETRIDFKIFPVQDEWIILYTVGRLKQNFEMRQIMVTGKYVENEGLSIKNRYIIADWNHRDYSYGIDRQRNLHIVAALDIAAKNLHKDLPQKVKTHIKGEAEETTKCCGHQCYPEVIFDDQDRMFIAYSCHVRNEFFDRLFKGPLREKGMFVVESFTNNKWEKVFEYEAPRGSHYDLKGFFVQNDVIYLLVEIGEKVFLLTCKNGRLHKKIEVPFGYCHKFIKYDDKLLLFWDKVRNDGNDRLCYSIVNSEGLGKIEYIAEDVASTLIHVINFQDKIICIWEPNSQNGVFYRIYDGNTWGSINKLHDVELAATVVSNDGTLLLTSQSKQRDEIIAVPIQVNE